MYGYADFIPAVKEEVFKRITQEEIYHHVLGYKPVPHIYITSPFRTDKHPGAYFEWYQSVLYFKDFGDTRRPVRDCFQVIMDHFKINYNQAILYVNDVFKLGLNTGNAKPVLYPLIEENSKGKLSTTRTKAEQHEIFIKTRPFNEYDKIFWYDRYLITRGNLIEDNVFPTVWFKFYAKKQKEWLIMRPFDICYTYMEFGDFYKKIYRPFISGKGKWLTNCTENQVGNIDNLPIKGHRLVITKSYKDCRILRNFGINSIWVQNEGMTPSDKVILDLLNRFNEIVILFDNDETGVLASKKLFDKLQSLVPDKTRELCFPMSLNKVGITDTGDFIWKKGPDKLQGFLREKDILYGSS